MSLLLTTVNTITVAELTDTNNTPAVFTHPVVNENLMAKWDEENIRNATSLQTAITNGDCVVTHGGVVVTDISLFGLGMGTGLTVVTTTVTVPATNTVPVNVDIADIMNIRLTFNSPPPVITPTGVVDPTNISTNEANMINGNLTDLTYNNSSTGTVNKELPAIDLGSPQTLSAATVHWWNNTYTASNYSIQGSNDATTWTDLATNLTSSTIVGTANNPQIIGISGSWRYIRVFCVQGDNTSWCVISELQVGGVSPGFITKLSSDELDIVSVPATQSIDITNNNNVSYDVTIVSRG